VRPDGTIPNAFEAQADACFADLLAILAAVAALVQLNAYLTDPADLAAHIAARDRHVAVLAPASTLPLVQALA
jgi:enamine deaminase RidA (YjgF/YER057c/UK114 family)